MSEQFTFTVMWRETGPDGIDRDRLKVCTYDTYGDADTKHRRACAGEWVKPHMRQVEVSGLDGVEKNRVRPIRAGRQLWTDPRGPLTDEERAALRKKLAESGSGRRRMKERS